MFFNVIQELARFNERYESPLIKQKKVVVVELDQDGDVLGLRTEEGVETIRWAHRCGIDPSPQPLCDACHYVLGISDDPKKAEFAARCRVASRGLHEDLAKRFPEIPELGAVAAFLGRKLPGSLEKASSKDKHVFEVGGVLLAGEKIVELAQSLARGKPSQADDGGEWECAFSGEKGPLFRGKMTSFRGPWVKTKRTSLVTCNRPVIDHGYVQDDAITNPMSPRIASLLESAPSTLVDRGQHVQLHHTVTLMWTREEHPLETMIPSVLRGYTAASDLKPYLSDSTGLYVLVSGSASRASVLHADLKPVGDVVSSVLELYGPRRDTPWNLMWWIQSINKYSRDQEPRLSITEASSWMRSVLSGEPLPRALTRRLLEPPRKQPPTGDHVRIASLRMYRKPR